jgi:hypothetical protein
MMPRQRDDPRTLVPDDGSSGNVWQRRWAVVARVTIVGKEFFCMRIERDAVGAHAGVRRPLARKKAINAFILLERGGGGRRWRWRWSAE